MLITKEVETTLNSRNTKYYESLNYKIPRIKVRGKFIVRQNTKIIVKVKDLSNGSKTPVDCECDGCEEPIIGIKWYAYKKTVKEDGTYYCKKCAMNGYKKWISFYEWCYLNLSKELADYILSRWDYELNKSSPKDIVYGSHGIDEKGYWFKCLDHPEHESEQKSIRIFAGFKEGSSLNCNQCNTIAVTHPHLVKYFINKEDSTKYSAWANMKIAMKCPECDYEKDILITNLTDRGFSCPKCSDGVPYPEKFILNFIEQIKNINFKTQLTKTTFDWVNTYKYDFYLFSINCIIETHGIQHYEDVKRWKMSLKDIQDNDFDKEWLAKENSIKNYIILDCRKSDMEWIKNSIMNSKLPKLLNFKEEEIDWLTCHEYACSSKIKETCDLWNDGTKSTLEIAKNLKVNKGTIVRYLKQGIKLGWCDYDPIEERKKNVINIKVICLTTGEIFNSQKEASIKYAIKNCGISACCNDRQKSAGKHPETGEALKWMYYSEYLIDHKGECNHESI